MRDILAKPKSLAFYLHLIPLVIDETEAASAFVYLVEEIFCVETQSAPFHIVGIDLRSFGEVDYLFFS